MLKKKFVGGLNDPKLHEKTTKNWVGEGLPILRIPPESNTMRIPVSALLSSNFDIMAKMRIEELDRMIIEHAQRI